jgi:hypothetical protein
MRARKGHGVHRGTVWIIVAGLWIATGYVGLNSYVMHLGAAHHDAFCTEH